MVVWGMPQEAQEEASCVPVNTIQELTINTTKMRFTRNGDPVAGAAPVAVLNAVAAADAARRNMPLGDELLTGSVGGGEEAAALRDEASLAAASAGSPSLCIPIRSLIMVATPSRNASLHINIMVKKTDINVTIV